MDDVPTGSEEETAQYCHQLYQEKVSDEEFTLQKK